MLCGLGAPPSPTLEELIPPGVAGPAKGWTWGRCPRRIQRPDAGHPGDGGKGHEQKNPLDPKQSAHSVSALKIHPLAQASPSSQ